MLQMPAHIGPHKHAALYPGLRSRLQRLPENRKKSMLHCLPKRQSTFDGQGQIL